MCSIGEDDFGDDGGVHAMIKDIQDGAAETDQMTVTGICEKCHQNPVVVKLNCREPECKDCFVAYVQHKFRATLGSSKILPKDADVLLIFDGSPESLVLLDMLHFAQTQNTFKRLHCNVSILFIDETCLLDQQSPQLTHQQLENIQKYLSQYSFEAFIVSLSSTSEDQSVPINFKNLNNYLQRQQHVQLFKENIEQIQSLTSRQDYIEQLRKKLIACTAKYFHKNYVFVPAISSNLASILLANISLGRGGSTAYEVALCDDRIPNLKIIRPLKDLNNSEVQNYIKLNILSIHNHNYCSYGTNGHGTNNASIQNLTSNFVLNLQKGFSSTVSTVFRIGDKIAANHNKSGFGDTMTTLSATKQCTFCHSNLDYLNSKTLLAIEFSRLVSENCATKNLENSNDLETNAKQNLYGQNIQELANLCHGCRNIYKECLDPTLFN